MSGAGHGGQSASAGVVTPVGRSGKSHKKMHIEVNGIRQEIQIDTTLYDLLSQLNIQQDRVAVELNLTVVDQKQFNHSLKEGDKIEIINFVGGGAPRAPANNLTVTQKSNVTQLSPFSLSKREREGVF